MADLNSKTIAHEKYIEANNEATERIRVEETQYLRDTRAGVAAMKGNNRNLYMATWKTAGK